MCHDCKREVKEEETCGDCEKCLICCRCCPGEG